MRFLVTIIAFQAATCTWAFLGRSVVMPRGQQQQGLAETPCERLGAFSGGNGGDSSGAEGMDPNSRPPRSMVPMRRDTCRVLVSGVLGADPKETYLANDHYVLNFPLAVTGHFAPMHDWELYKPTETMWLASEVWDTQAKNNQANFKKGAPVCGIGYLIFNTWKDKATGEDRKQFKMRFTNILTPEEMDEILGSSGIEDLLPTPHDEGGEDGLGDSGFSSSSPPMYDQAIRAPPVQRMQPGGRDPARGGGGGGGGRSKGELDEDVRRDNSIPF